MNSTDFLRRCNHASCLKEGVYPAPKTRQNPRDFLWFCLEHVREYNARWNCFADLTSDQIEHEIRRATVWERPTWPFGKGPLSKTGTSRRNTSSAFETPPHSVMGALGVLGLSVPTTRTAIKARYRQLAKAFHPDANEGSKEKIEKFYQLQQAFATLKKYYAMKDRANVSSDE